MLQATSPSPIEFKMATNFHIFTDEDLERKVYLEGDALAKEVMARWLADAIDREAHYKEVERLTEKIDRLEAALEDFRAAYEDLRQAHSEFRE